MRTKQLHSGASKEMKSSSGLKLFFAAFEGVFMGLELRIMGSQNVMGLGYGSNISVLIEIFWRFFECVRYFKDQDALYHIWNHE